LQSVSLRIAYDTCMYINVPKTHMVSLYRKVSCLMFSRQIEALENDAPTPKDAFCRFGIFTGVMCGTLLPALGSCCA